MKLINVRRGQFVYYENKLHKVYSVNPFFKNSVHIARLSDLEQVLVKAKEINYYRPKHLDSFFCNGQRFTLHKEKRAQVGDYILVINPRPDSLDHHHLHAIELVSSLEDNGVISNKSNGIRHDEYWVMVPGELEDATRIDQQFPEDIEDEDVTAAPELEEVQPEDPLPKIGDIFQKRNAEPVFQTMVLAIEGRTIYLGGGLKVPAEELVDPEKWTQVLNVYQQ